MDINSNDAPSEMDFAKVPILALRQTARSILSRSLNPVKVLLSEEGIQRDWRGIAHLAGLHSLYGPFITAEKDPMAKVLSLWCKECDNQTANFDNLIKFLGEIDRWDVADDLSESLAEDAEAYKSKKYQQQLIVARKEASEACNEFQLNTADNQDGDILTIDDVERAQQGLPPQKYDAFVLFADEDVDFAGELIDRMEEDHPKFGFKLCFKQRDIIGGVSFEHEAILRLISERCDRLIVIVSPAFLKSAANTFFINFAAALQIEQRRRKIIPCLYEPCALPPTLSFYFYLKYYQRGRFFNFWDKLGDSIRQSHNVYTNGNSIPVSAPPRIYIEEIREEPQKAIMQNPVSAPIKKPRKKAAKAPVPDPLRVYSLPEPSIRPALSMNQLNSLAASDTNGNKCDISTRNFDFNRSESNLSQISSNTSKSTRGKAKWYKMLLPSLSSGSKADLAVNSSASFDSTSKPKRKRSWLKKKLTADTS